MESSQKIDMFKGILDSLIVYFEFDESNVNYSTEIGYTKDLIYCRLVQYTHYNKRIEYDIEYRINFDVITLEINFPMHLDKIMFKQIKENLLHSGVTVEKLKNTLTCKFYYNWENVSKITSVALLMIAISKLKSY